MTTTTIKQQVESVNHIDLNLFYVVEFNKWQVKLQGRYSFEIRKYCESLGFQFEITPNDWIKAEKENIIVVLTF